MHPITNTLCVGDKDYEKALKTFAQYCNYERFKQRVVSNQTLQVKGWVKESPRMVACKPLSSNWSSSGWKREDAERELFKKLI